MSVNQRSSDRLHQDHTYPAVEQRKNSHDPNGYHHQGHRHGYAVPTHRAYSSPSSYPPHYMSSRPTHQLRPVVTSSFSLDEEREDHHSRHVPKRHLPASVGASMEERNPEPREMVAREMEEVRVPPPPPPRQQPPMEGQPQGPTPVTPSPRVDHPPTYVIKRTHSAGAYHTTEPMKRSFWHHAQGGAEYEATGGVPPEFAPPKRPKLAAAKTEIVITARPPSDKYSIASERVQGVPYRPAGWFNRAMSWEAREAEMVHYQIPAKSHSFPAPWTGGRSPHHATASPHGYHDGQEWADSPGRSVHPPPSPHGQPVAHYPPNSPSGSYHGPPPRWNSPASWTPPQSTRPSVCPPWGAPPPSSQYRDDVESARAGWHSTGREKDVDADGEVRRQVTFESGCEVPPYRRSQMVYPPPQSPKVAVRTQPASHYADDPKKGIPRTLYTVESPTRDEPPRAPVELDKSICLLALPEDKISLSETLCVVRENIEVFTANRQDVEAPAPGRKHAVVVGQVGLRCIHCRHTTRSSDRVKRAVCYPSSIKRIYRTVIDMKLDHFLHCKFVPMALKDRLNELKATNTRSTGTTMQYFIRAAKTLGMVDGTSGVRLVKKDSEQNDGVAKKPSTDSADSDTSSLPTVNSNKVCGSEPSSPSRSAADTAEARPEGGGSVSSNSDTAENLGDFFTGKICLGLPEDRLSLSPLRCFLREQVCAFSATPEDIAVRTPTTFSVSVGQVGIGCIHCLNQPAKLRSNRAVCFPFSIARIYQSVADIQRFHLGECKMVPTEVKDKFLSLQSASSKGSKGLATRQYWITSAKKIGLVDTPQGIRFGRDPSVPEKPAISLDILAQVASNVTTASKPLVLPADKPQIAEFLYVVMEQLQPCRFTEADRNKRRLKDVGCIGVECKHCARQVDSRKFFWSSVNAVESNFVSVHTHMMECRMVPESLKMRLAHLKTLRKEQTAALKTGSQKAFFQRVWNRLHGTEDMADEEEDVHSTATCYSAPGSPPTSHANMEQEESYNTTTTTSAPNSPNVKNVSRGIKKLSVVSV